MFSLAFCCLTTSNLPWFMDLTVPGSCTILFFTASNFTSITSHINTWVLFLLWLSLFILSGIISPLFSSSIHLPTWGVHLSVSYLFVFSYCSWGSQGKNTEVVCQSLLQWTTFCQNSSFSREVVNIQYFLDPPSQWSDSTSPSCSCRFPELLPGDMLQFTQGQDWRFSCWFLTMAHLGKCLFNYMLITCHQMGVWRDSSWLFTMGSHTPFLWGPEPHSDRVHSFWGGPTMLLLLLPSHFSRVWLCATP